MKYTTRPLSDRNSFFLTQRLTRRTTTGGKGFDAAFACQYMGAAEFEWGAIPESLKRIRAAKKIGVHEGVVTRRSITATVFVVGDVKRIAAVPDLLTDWLVDDYPRGKESTYFPEAVDGTTQEWHADTHAWWALNADVMWTLDAGIADDLLKAVSRG